MAALRLLLIRFKNAASNSHRLFSSSAALMRPPWTVDSNISDGESAVYKQALKLQRPTTVQYEDSLHNSISLIGAIDRPLRKCNCDIIGVHTLLRTNAPRGAYRNFNVMLKFWDGMAEMAVQHLKLNDLVYVSGRLGSYMKVDENGKLMQCYEVVVREVNFVSRNGLGPAEQSLVKLEPAVTYEDMKKKRRDRLHLWQIYFASPSEWWDNRSRKKLNPNSPDFKHKDTGEVLWLQDNDPPWVRKQLQLHDSRLYKRGPGEHRNAWSHLSPLVYE
ncbi:Protein osb1, mitochondrial-like [Orobanche minor]